LLISNNSFFIESHCKSIHIVFTGNLITFSFLFQSWKIPQTQLRTALVLLQNNYFVGFVQVSPVYNEKFFEFQSQGRDQTITGAVCFSPRNHKIFTDYNEKNSPIKVKKFNVVTSSNTNDMLVGDTVVVEHYRELDFSRSEIQSSTTLSSVKSV